ncbi:hypothetical protein [Methanobrevibacter boviskoreani]|uniref:hypothetical protein n=1 Tax=Methanobrevibacter boviskoreani TaxID=1348249 RepID=UPI000593FA52|nr:hypothetical protein [Methanobrevibacter boviskoreani]
MVTYEALKNRPRIVVNDNTNYLSLDGVGAEIPVFIVGSNHEVENISIESYTNSQSVIKSLGPDSPDVKIITDFFEEAKVNATGQLGVEKVYVIDIGNKNVTADTFVQALEVSERAKDATMIVLNKPLTVTVNTTLDSSTNKETTTITDGDNMSLVAQVSAHIKKLRSKGQPRIGYFPAGSIETTEDYDDKILTHLTHENTYIDDNIVFIENRFYGKVLAKIATTPYFVEPGRDAFRSLNEYSYVNDSSEGTIVRQLTFPKRSDEESTALMKSGVLFCESDPYRVNDNGEPLQVICIGVSTGFARSDEEKTTACLLHALRNNNHQIREVMKILGTQLKENETIDAITKFKLAVDTYLESEVKADHIQPEYTCNIYESDEDPYNLVINLGIAGINATYLIEYNNEILKPQIIITEGE